MIRDPSKRLGLLAILAALALGACAARSIAGDASVPRIPLTRTQRRSIQSALEERDAIDRETHRLAARRLEVEADLSAVAAEGSAALEAAGIHPLPGERIGFDGTVKPDGVWFWQKGQGEK